MATSLLDGHVTWSGSRDSEGHRQYKIKHRVRAGRTDGPANVLATPGLPLPGALWVVDGDVDLYAWCRPDATVSLQVDEQENTYWLVEQTFSTKPLRPEQQRCGDTPVEDPLLEPAKISGGFSKYTEEATRDRFGRAILTSSHEVIRGPAVEFDQNRPSVRIEINRPVLGVDVWGPMVDAVNREPLWGLPARSVKLSNVTWERKFKAQCEVYYTLVYDFDVNVKDHPVTGEKVSGWDRDILDEGTKVLNGHWDGETGAWILDEINALPPDPRNPKHFIRFKDRNGENTRVILNGAGLPAGVAQGVGSYFVSLVDNNTADLDDGESWVPVSGPDTPTEWTEGTQHVAGNVVLFDGETYIAVQNPPLFEQPPTVDTDSWVLLPGGLIDDGNWDADETYTTGSIVNGNVATTVAGNVHVQKYPSADLLLLGIPILI